MQLHLTTNKACEKKNSPPDVFPQVGFKIEYSIRFTS